MECASPWSVSFFLFFNDTATTEIYTLSLHDALPIYRHDWCRWLFIFSADAAYIAPGIVTGVMVTFIAFVVFVNALPNLASFAFLTTPFSASPVLGPFCLGP